MRILLISVLFAVGCGGRAPVPVTPPPPPPVVMAQCPPDALAVFPLAKAYVDARGRLFCYDDTEAQADPSLLPLRWDRAGEQIRSIRPTVDLDSPYPLNAMVFKFQPHDIIAWNGVPIWYQRRMQGFSPTDMTELVGNFRMDTFPVVIDILAEGYTSLPVAEGGFGEQEPLGRLTHEARHAIAWASGMFNTYCRVVGPDGSVTSAPLYQWIGHGTQCDEFSQ